MHLFIRSMAIALSMALPAITHAQALIDNSIADCNFKTGEIHAKCVPLYIAHLIQFLFSLTGGIFVIMGLWAGYQIALAKLTNQENAGKERLKFAIIGMLSCICSWYIIDFIISALAGI